MHFWACCLGASGKLALSTQSKYCALARPHQVLQDGAGDRDLGAFGCQWLKPTSLASCPGGVGLLGGQTRRMWAVRDQDCACLRLWELLQGRYVRFRQEKTEAQQVQLVPVAWLVSGSSPSLWCKASGQLLDHLPHSHRRTHDAPVRSGEGGTWGCRMEHGLQSVSLGSVSGWQPPGVCVSAPPHPIPCSVRAPPPQGPGPRQNTSLRGAPGVSRVCRGTARAQAGSKF